MTAVVHGVEIDDKFHVIAFVVVGEVGGYPTRSLPLGKKSLPT